MAKKTKSNGKGGSKTYVSEPKKGNNYPPMPKPPKEKVSIEQFWGM